MVLEAHQVGLVVHELIPEVEMEHCRFLDKASELLEMVLKVDRRHIVHPASLGVGALSLIKLVLNNLSVAVNHE